MENKLYPKVLDTKGNKTVFYRGQRYGNNAYVANFLYRNSQFTTYLRQKRIIS